MTTLEGDRTVRDRAWVILFCVGVAGLILTFWLARFTAQAANERLEQRFEIAARERAASIVEEFRIPIEQLFSVRRLFDSVGGVEREVFENFSEPIMRRYGVRGIRWAPYIQADERDDFERNGKRLWGHDFSILDHDAEGVFFRAGTRAQYFPVLYALPRAETRKSIGLDLYAHHERGEVLMQAIEQGQAVASEVGQSIGDGLHFDEIVAIALPVYRAGQRPEQREARLREVRGVLVGLLDIGALFDSANAKGANHGLRTVLFDHASPTIPIRSWQAEGSAAAELPSAGVLTHTQSFELANRLWMVRIVAEPAWIQANSTRSMEVVVLSGFCLTALMLVGLNWLLRRSRRVTTLETELELGQARQQAAEDWAKKLSLAVEQNPASIIITDIDGKIEFANDTFLATTGYALDEVLGKTPLLVQSDDTPREAYAELWREISAGRIWRGDLQNRRKDGGQYWERVLVAPIKAPDGSIASYIWINEDITELRALFDQLRDSDSRFRGVLATMVEGVAVLSPKGHFIYSNPAAENAFGCPDGGLIGRRPEELPVERLRADGSLCPPGEFPLLVTLREQRELRDITQGIRARDGSVRWLRVNTCVLRSSGEGSHHGVVLTFTDVTERQHAEEQLRLAFEVINHTSEGVMVSDAQHRILSINPALERMIGLRNAQIIGRPSGAFVRALDDASFAAVNDALVSGRPWQGEVRLKKKTGRSLHSWAAIAVVRDNENRIKHHISVFSDMTERKEAQERIEFLAHHDPLTGLPNRLLLRDRVAQALAQALRMQNRVALMFLDLDRFKTINDSLGHPVGDALLKEVVERLRTCVRDTDTICRQGGDEFIILLNDVRDSEAVSRIAEKIHLRMTEPVLVGKHQLSTSFSIGIALGPDDASDFDTLLQKADTAMYHAKEAGRNSHRFFTEQMNRQVVEHLTLENKLRRALDNREFVLYYQPQIDLAEGRIVGVEALIRWNSPEDGLVSPGRFIPVAEASGLIAPIGAWVLREACRQARAWQDAGLPPFVVAVNLSAMQFKRPDLINTVINALVLADLDSQWLELELTESILIQDAESTVDSVRRLKALGVKLSVDDFGTGYSSLAYLKRFAVDKLKIDQSFVRDLGHDPEDSAIVRAIVQMAHSMKLTTIAEGVETQELADLLRLFHCDEAQGFWLAKPLPADELEAFVRARMKVPGDGVSI
ncbi:MAG: EAL domain-containing protein [Propionivibrio sp.]